MKNANSIGASSRRIRGAYLSRNCPPLSWGRLSGLAQDLLGGLLFGLVLAGLLLLLLL